MARTVGALRTWASAAFTNTVRALVTVATLFALHLPCYCSSGAAKEDSAAAAKGEAVPKVVDSRAEPRESPHSSLSVSGKKAPVAYDALPASLVLLLAQMERLMMDARAVVRSCNGGCPSASDGATDHDGDKERRLHEARIAELERKLKEKESEACRWRELAKLAACFTDSASVGKESIDCGKATGGATEAARRKTERTDDDKKRSSGAPRKKHARIRSFSSSSTTTGGTSLEVGRQRAASAAGDASKERPARPTTTAALRPKTMELRRNNSAKQTGTKRPLFLVRRASWPEDLSREVVLNAEAAFVASRSSSERALCSQAPKTREALDEEEGAKKRDGPGDEEVGVKMKRDKFPGITRARPASERIGVKRDSVMRTRPASERIDVKRDSIMRARPVSAFQQRVDAKMMAPPQTPSPPPPPPPSAPDSARKVVVLYVTSLRGIPETYEDCRSTKSILQGYGVRVDERDLWMHEGFKDELRAMLGAPGRLSLPQAFADGKHLGGAEEIRRKHASGELSGALEACKMAAPLEQACAGCGGVRFVPCQECSGSCKVFLEEAGGFRRCPKCNANGLVRCPLCSL